MNIHKKVSLAIIIALLLWATYLAAEITAFRREVREFSWEVSAVTTQQREVILKKLERPVPVMVVSTLPPAQQHGKYASGKRYPTLYSRL
jgi:hypothetical protein